MKEIYKEKKERSIKSITWESNLTILNLSLKKF